MFLKDIDLTTGSNGASEKFTLPCTASGTYNYWVKELTAPAGHKLNSTVQKVTIVLPRDADKDIQVKFTDEPIYCQHSLDVQKISAKGWPIPGVIFKAQYFDAKSADSKKLVKTWYLKSGDDGKVFINSKYLSENHKSDSFFKDTSGKVVIPIGGYLQLQEVEAPAEYVIDDTPFGFLTTETVKMERKFPNFPEPCKIRLKKLDSAKRPLQGVEFKIEFIKEAEASNGTMNPSFKPLLKIGESTTGTTDGNGMLIFSNLDQGTYRITETKTVEGNSLMKDPIEVTVPMTMTEAEAKSYGNVDFSTAKQDTNYTDKWFFYDCLYEITNTPLLKLPTTGSSGVWKYGFIGISMIAVLTGGIVVYETRNKKKRRRHHKKS